MKNVIICNENLVYNARNSIENIQNIYINAVIGQIIVIPCDDENDTNVSAEFYFGNPNHAVRCKMSMTSQNNTIKIELKSSKFFFYTFTLSEIVIMVKIPNKYQQNIQIDGVAGNLEIGGLNADILKASVVSGNAVISDVIANQFTYDSVSGKSIFNNIHANLLDINSKSGAINLNGAFLKKSDCPVDNSKLSINIVSGKTLTKVCSCFENINIDTISGSVDLTLPSNYQFNTKYNSISGKVKTNTLMNNGYECANNGKVNQVNISCITGSITVNQ